MAIFCLVASKAVFSQNQYQSRVTSAKEKANSQLKRNLQAFDSLVGAYQTFDNTPVNIINGNKDGSGDNDGSNSKIILDSLPSSYDFPALASSVEKILSSANLKVSAISGTDDQVSQQSNVASANPRPVPIPFSFTINGANYVAVQQLVSKLQTSIRPIQIDSLNLTGGAASMTVTVNAHTYYQPGKSVNITTKVIK